MKEEYSFLGTDDILVYDIETKTPEDSPNPEKDELRVFGAYSYKTNKYYVVPFTDKKFIGKMINKHKFTVGFNNIDYDNTVLEREGFSFKYKRNIDLYQIFKERAGNMMTEKGMLRNELMKYSLDYITKFLDLVDDDTGKKDLDYSVLNKKRWSDKEREKIKEYTKRDVKITKKLYEWVEKYFQSFKEYVPKEDVSKKYYLTDSIAKFSYKAICHALGWEPTCDYNAGRYSNEKTIKGGYVSYPAGKKFTGDIYCLDYSSLYPHIMIQCNLYGRKKDDEEGWSGGDKWDVEGTYNTEQMSPVSKLLRNFYHLRLFYKRKIELESNDIISMKNIENHIGEKYYKVEKDKSGKMSLKLESITEDVGERLKKLYEDGKDLKEYTIKIIINTIYGIMSTPFYQNVFDITAAGDCTRIGRQWTKYARKVFRDAGYEILYSDTDSWYIKDVYHDKEKMLKLKDKVIQDIRNSVPFPQSTFDADVDAEIKHMFFFKGRESNDGEEDYKLDKDDKQNKKKGFMKKNYIYVTKDDKLTIKNLGVAKKTISPLTKKIFWDYLVPEIKEGKIKFSKTKIENHMRELLRDNVELACMRKSVKPLSQYKNDTSIHARISKRYGSGIHFLIPNIRHIGVGKSRSYCSVEEFNEYDMDVVDIDFEVFWKELDYFIKQDQQLTLFEVEDA